MQNSHPTNDPQAPVVGNVAIYARGATPAQLTKEPKQVQTDDLINLARNLGYEDTHIFVFEQDNGIPGNTGINERVALSAIVQAIVKDTIHAVLVADEIRLFRDVSEIQLSIFIRLCQDHNAVVITPEMTYDFHIPTNVKLFRFKCEPGHSVLEDTQAN